MFLSIKEIVEALWNKLLEKLNLIESFVTEYPSGFFSYYGVTAQNRHIYRIKSLSYLYIELPDTMPDGFICKFLFKTEKGIPIFSTNRTNVEEAYGDDCSNGIFTPVFDSSYEVTIQFTDGKLYEKVEKQQKSIAYDLFYTSSEDLFNDITNKAFTSGGNYTPDAIAKVYLDEDDGITNIKLLSDLHLPLEIKLDLSNCNLDLNKHTLSIDRPMWVKTGSCKVTDGKIVGGTSQGSIVFSTYPNTTLVLDECTVVCDWVEGSSTASNLSVIGCINQTSNPKAIVKNCDIYLNWRHNVYCFYKTSLVLANTNVTILDSVSGSDISTMMYIADKGSLRIQGGNYIVNTSGSNHCLSATSGSSNVEIQGGTFGVNARPSGDNMSADGVCFTVSGEGGFIATEDASKLSVSGGNSAVQITGEVFVDIRGGTFKSPNHGGVYISTTSTADSEAVTIAGGTFLNNWDELSQEYQAAIQPYGASYFGVHPELPAGKYGVTIKGARFINNQRRGIVQKSSDNYCPITLHLYNTYVSGEIADIQIQNNESVAKYEAFVHLHEGTVLEHNTIDDQYEQAHPGNSHVIDHRTNN